MSVDDVLQKIIEICRELSAEKVYLYGSRAKGTNVERSDIDIAAAGVKEFERLEDVVLYGRKIYE